MKKNASNTTEETLTPITVGLLAHVDAGKTTLAEAMLYTAGKLRKAGRVDHKNAFLDTYELEKTRGITIFSKQAQLGLNGQPVTLLDTPGHADFSPETERTLSVLDYAVFVISARDGVQGHVLTLWRLLEHYNIPVFLFINKMDQDGCEKKSILKELREKLGSGCVDFSAADNLLYEELAGCCEEAMEEYLETGSVNDETIRASIASRFVFPCFFGSALKLQGIDEFLESLRRYMKTPSYPEEFGARVFKVGRGAHGERLTYLKVTGGRLKVKTSPFKDAQEKIDQIRIYDGSGYQVVDEAPAGCICAAAGPEHVCCGEGLGFEENSGMPQLVPVLTYRILFPEGCDEYRAFLNIRQLEEEEPQLHIMRSGASGEIHVQVMGEVQLEILKSIIKERFDLDVEFGEGSIIYKETIKNTVEGVGHFEPLRHYAEVHLLLEPAPAGSGLTFCTDCSEDILDRNWQRLVLTHLAEKRHAGVLTGSEITDMKITLKSGRAHNKHTEGGDFREAVYRAVRQGLMQAECVLLEPYYAFELEIPSEMLGRAMSDIQRMSGRFEPPGQNGGMVHLTGFAPISAMRFYPAELASYSRGSGKIFCEFSGYEPCHEAEKIIAETAYNADADTENPSSSVFCSHGSSFTAAWNEVPRYMHLESVLKKEEQGSVPPEGVVPGAKSAGTSEGDLKEIFERTYGKGSFQRSSEYAYYAGSSRENEQPGRVQSGSAQTGRVQSGSVQNGSAQAGSVQAGNVQSGSAQAGNTQTGNVQNGSAQAGSVQAGNVQNGSVQTGSVQAKNAQARGTAADGTLDAENRRYASRAGSHQIEIKEQYLIVDGYNIIFAWDELKALARENIDAARDRLMDILCNYQGFRGMKLLLVFDGYRVRGNSGEIFKHHNIDVVYTREGETADQYIEKTVLKIGKEFDVTVATSDRLEQISVFSHGARRMPAAELYKIVEETAEELRLKYLNDAAGK